MITMTSPPANVPECTPKQLNVLDQLHVFRERNGFSPTVDELGTVFGLTRAAIHLHIEGLIAGGLVEKIVPDSQRKRNWRLTQRGLEVLLAQRKRKKGRHKLNSKRKPKKNCTAALSNKVHEQ
jgi:DNA-binding MarR family transcriptional regulator